MKSRSPLAVGIMLGLSVFGCGKEKKPDPNIKPPAIDMPAINLPTVNEVRQIRTEIAKRIGQRAFGLSPEESTPEKVTELIKKFARTDKIETIGEWRIAFNLSLKRLDEEKPENETPEMVQKLASSKFSQMCHPTIYYNPDGSWDCFEECPNIPSNDWCGSGSRGDPY